MKLEEAWHNYEAYKLIKLNQKCQENDALRWNKYVVSYFGNCDIGEINGFAVDKFRNFLENNDLSPQTVKHVLVTYS